MISSFILKFWSEVKTINISSVLLKEKLYFCILYLWYISRVHRFKLVLLASWNIKLRPFCTVRPNPSAKQWRGTKRNYILTLDLFKSFSNALNLFIFNKKRTQWLWWPVDSDVHHLWRGLGQSRQGVRSSFAGREDLSRPLAKIGQDRLSLSLSLYVWVAQGVRAWVVGQIGVGLAALGWLRLARWRDFAVGRKGAQGSQRVIGLGLGL